MGCYLTNTWWRDDAKGVCINLSKRFSYSIYALITTLKEYTVLISLILGIVLILFAEWINVTSNEQQKKMDQPFIDIDVFIGQTIQNLNYLTQDVPNMAISWTNQTMYQSGGVANSVLQTSFNSISNTLNTGTTGLENIANQLVQFFLFSSRKVESPYYFYTFS
jgi:ABC-type transport system involved in multi-copper enzyme maturation permease subunit